MAPLYVQQHYPTREAADAWIVPRVEADIATRDANDLIYQLEASREYNPAPKLETITAPLIAVNSADDFINPPELGIIEREIKRVKRGRFVMIPISEETRGHGTHTIAKIWQEYLKELLDESAAAGK
jgi:homoserine O-acetyltransferase